MKTNKEQCTKDLRTHQANVGACRIPFGRFLAIFLIAVAGCSQMIKRGQSPEVDNVEFEENGKETNYVGDVSMPVGLNTLNVDGLGLVIDLDGTGSDPPATPQREFLVDEIKTHNVDDINGLLSSKNNSMVAIDGSIPAGARKGDRFDIRVKVLDNSKTTSLRGGFLMQARLKPMLVLERSVKLGRNLAYARGRVLADSLFEAGTDENMDQIGVVLGGGVVAEDRKIGLIINNELHDEMKDRFNQATAIARAINGRFNTKRDGAPAIVATPKSDKEIEIAIPDDYRHNLGRYVHVILNIAFDENAEGRVNRLEFLERELNNPSRANLAAIRLEAVGTSAVPALKRAIRSSDSEVRFHAAQALAYMGEPDGVKVLAAAADSEPKNRWHALTAMGSLSSRDGEEALIGLFNSASAEARYGAFQTLRDNMPESFALSGERLGRELNMHVIPTTGRSMVHFSRRNEQEIVMFGRDMAFNDRLLYIDSGLTIKSVGIDQVELIRYGVTGGEQKITCSNQVDEVIRNAVKLGADYGDVLSLMKDAKRSDAIQAQLVINALPTLGKSQLRTAESGSDVGTGSPDDLQYSSQTGSYTSAVDESANPSARKKGFFDRINPWR